MKLLKSLVFCFFNAVFSACGQVCKTLMGEKVITEEGMFVSAGRSGLN